MCVHTYHTHTHTHRNRQRCPNTAILESLLQTQSTNHTILSLYYRHHLLHHFESLLQTQFTTPFCVFTTVFTTDTPGDRRGGGIVKGVRTQLFLSLYYRHNLLHHVESLLQTHLGSEEEEESSEVSEQRSHTRWTYIEIV